MRYKVYSLDVWGHSPEECQEGKPEACDCSGFEVNDRFFLGYIEIGEDCDESDVLDLLQGGGYLRSDVQHDEVVIEWVAEGVYDVDQADGRPVFQLESVE
jgi:hypothetical protein